MLVDKAKMFWIASTLPTGHLNFLGFAPFAATTPKFENPIDQTKNTHCETRFHPTRTMATTQITLDDGLQIIRSSGNQRFQRIAANDFQESFTAKEFMELCT
jgi:hypothetical protein